MATSGLDAAARPFVGRASRGDVILKELAQLAGALAVLKRAAGGRARVVVPLLRVARADAADVAALINQRLVARRADQRRRVDRRRTRVVPLVRAAERFSDAAPRTLQELLRARQLTSELL